MNDLDANRLRSLLGIFSEIIRERERQDKLHGPPGTESDERMVAVLAEETGEVAKAMLEGDKEGLKKELIEVMAVCCKWREALE